MPRLKGILEVLSTLTVMVAAGVFMWTQLNGGAPAATAATPAPAPMVEDVKGTIAAERVRNVAGRGDLAIVEFTDFQCPFCARHAKETVPALLKLDGVRYVSMHLPLPSHSQAVAAAELAECAAEQGKYWEAHAALFDGQAELKTGVLPVVPGVDAKALAACLDADKALARVLADQKEAARLGLNSTPSVFIGRMRKDGGIDLVKGIVGARPAEVFAAEVAKLTQG